MIKRNNSFSIGFNKKSFTTITTISLLLIVTVLAVSIFKIWYIEYETNTLTTIETSVDINSVTVEKLLPNKIFIKNNNLNNITVNELKIGSTVCRTNIVLLANQLNEVDLNDCLSDSFLGLKKITLIAEKNIFEDEEMLDYLYQGHFLISFNTGSCSEGYIKIYGLENTSNAHGEISTQSNYPYSLCLKHDMYILDVACNNPFTRLFYLDNESNGHAYTDTTSPYVDTWTELCINTNNENAEITSTISTSNPDDGSICVASLNGIDNVNGVHMGYCNAYSTRVWLKIE